MMRNRKAKKTFFLIAKYIYMVAWLVAVVTLCLFLAMIPDRKFLPLLREWSIPFLIPIVLLAVDLLEYKQKKFYILILFGLVVPCIAWTSYFIVGYTKAKRFDRYSICFVFTENIEGLTTDMCLKFIYNSFLVRYYLFISILIILFLKGVVLVLDMFGLNIYSRYIKC
ncbi:hypothetical protein RF11_07983 [Thelohanellus kitauei]|uniref:Uncharacterized protein n=1 Tax=Thelohanellus kitauei TaxID=669202 RepID=A0A0C2MM20_THEKT|nr:hypothetical protein RF11_07983 [Thelohanellus kitauei]